MSSSSPSPPPSKYTPRSTRKLLALRILGPGPALFTLLTLIALLALAVDTLCACPNFRGVYTMPPSGSCWPGMGRVNTNGRSPPARCKHFFTALTQSEPALSASVAHLSKCSFSASSPTSAFGGAVSRRTESASVLVTAYRPSFAARSASALAGGMSGWRRTASTMVRRRQTTSTTSRTRSYMCPVLLACELRACECACPMNAAIVDRKLSCVCRSASITSAVVAGPDGNTGVAGVPTESLENDDDEELLLIESCAGRCWRGVPSLNVRRMGEVSCCSDSFR
ncbi:hypothetical protein GSI_15050 [Ganoderma sinense ZZ0214-1]|uniref:Uncharacterized protein n=1 Tax=Ganoderma sinense ZZ0214-1 TaxID=1077348 RepID=A0A2G8RLH3_9APHY|nr:hypothetical protein GSI_15050 [Ganoderma sinense ZZ0214-1]